MKVCFLCLCLNVCVSASQIVKTTGLRACPFCGDDCDILFDVHGPNEDKWTSDPTTTSTPTTTSLATREGGASQQEVLINVNKGGGKIVGGGKKPMNCNAQCQSMSIVRMYVCLFLFMLQIMYVCMLCMYVMYVCICVCMYRYM